MISSRTKAVGLHELPISSPATLPSLNFTLPPELEAAEPPEARGLVRDEVRLMVSRYTDDTVVHTHFRDLPNVLSSGDLLVINTSGTLNAALSAWRADETQLEVHVSTHLPADLWIVELRQPTANASLPYRHGIAGETLRLFGGGTLELHVPYHDHRSVPDNGPVRLWIATFELPVPLHAYLARYGFPIRYSYVRRDWSSEYYQTVYANEPGSAEMPSAGRAFTPELLTRLVAKGIMVVPLVLHAGVASLEEHEPPYEEWYRVPLDTANAVNAARQAGRRIIAVGTTVVRALETVTDSTGVTHPGEGWTREIITPARGIRAVNSLLTGLHEPRATHLAMLAALAGRHHLQLTYAEALRQQYLWHEFGDLHLLLP